ncbi:uncharacterized protein LOC127841948 isoform X2 [Dreissena polymorpha]|uniref:uncharacterized protein LOC127841948 isoform X2 n=1 Tax=Dreissena polymorpha TaxID=45954 RepID=UPI0022640CC4|nr:uncharacterized protein LOC127841948 isoform X2 [Dreissena polymorpha]
MITENNIIDVRKLQMMKEGQDAIKTTDGIPLVIQSVHREPGTRNTVRVSYSKTNNVTRAGTSVDPPNNGHGQHHTTNMEIPEHLADMSIRLSGALDEIGADKNTVLKRRGIFMWRERMETITGHLMGEDMKCFHFGSQSEGTTTPGLQSDIDLLKSFNDINIMRYVADWEEGMHNLLMLHDNITPPQQYLLQLFRNDRPEPVNGVYQYEFVRKESGQILLSSERYKHSFELWHQEQGVATLSGPSVSFIRNWDIVHGFHVCKPLPEIQHWIDRCRGRYWPSTQLLDAASAAPCFMVPAGHPDSDYRREEWRLSPNLIERMLMFSFNIIQIKCYIVLKLIKKYVFSKIVDDSFTSFHCKTIMFYTIERINQSFWMEHNLVFLILQCLETLKKFLRLGIMPHYILHGVNLFDGKLSRKSQRHLLENTDSLIRTNLQELFHIDADNLRCRLLSCRICKMGQLGRIERVCLSNSISLLLKFECLAWFIQQIRIPKSKRTIVYRLLTVATFCKNVRFKSVAIEIATHLFALQNSVSASNCLSSGNVGISDIIARFRHSFNTDVASSRLKLASVLYCGGHLHSAVRVLEDVERRYHSEVKAVCGHRVRIGDRDLKVFANKSSCYTDVGFSDPPFAYCVKFGRYEINCAPFILWFEMNRGTTEDELANRSVNQKEWMFSAEVDARPFIYYLQYLTYGGLGEPEKQEHAMVNLHAYVCGQRNLINLYHSETDANMLGHCYEMEGEYEMALECYSQSLRQIETNNAAKYHVDRIQRLLIVNVDEIAS